MQRVKLVQIHMAFLDASHILERLLRCPPQDLQNVRNPRRKTRSTFTGQSKIVVRRLCSLTKLLTLRPLFCIEAMRMIGWDFSF